MLLFEAELPLTLFDYLFVAKVMLMAGDHLFFLWRFMSRPHHENRNIGIYCKNVIELRRHWQHLKKYLNTVATTIISFFNFPT